MVKVERSCVPTHTNKPIEVRRNSPIRNTFIIYKTQKKILECDLDVKGDLFLLKYILLKNLLQSLNHIEKKLLTFYRIFWYMFPLLNFQLLEGSLIWRINPKMFRWNYTYNLPVNPYEECIYMYRSTVFRYLLFLFSLIYEFSLLQGHT